MKIFKRITIILSLHNIIIRLSKNYVIEFSVFRKMRRFKEGLIFCSFYFDIEIDKSYDHTPWCKIYLTLLNFEIFDFHLYNINHVEDFEEQ